MRPRVLVVEDNAVSLELVLALLEVASCEVLTAETANAAVRLATAERPDLILMDVQLPDMTEYEAVKRLKTNPATAAIPVIALTAQAMPGEEARAQAAGCEGYLTKPLDTHIFLETLRRFLPAGEAEGGA